MAKKRKLKDNKTPLQEAFGEIVRTRRLNKEMSQEDLADGCDLHFTYISSVERGERNISLANISKIAKALSCKMKDLMPD